MLPDKPTPLDAEVHFRDLLAAEGFAQPDEVEYDAEDDELVFRWHEQKVVIVVELSDAGPEDVRTGTLMPPV